MEIASERRRPFSLSLSLSASRDKCFPSGIMLSAVRTTRQRCPTATCSKAAGRPYSVSILNATVLHPGYLAPLSMGRRADRDGHARRI